MLTRKDLRDLGITDEEQITAIINRHKGEIEDLKETHKSAQPQTKPAETAPTQPPASAAEGVDVEALRRELAAEKAKNEERVRRDLVTAALSKHKPVRADTLYRLLDQQQIVIEDGIIKSGLDEQIKALKDEQGFLFSDTPDSKGGADPTGTASPTTMNQIIRGG